MSTYVEKAKAASCDRRTFVKGAASVAVTLAAAGGLTACGADAAVSDDASTTGASRDIVSGEWIPAACWHGCSTRMCVNKVLMQDGVAIRQKTDDCQEDGMALVQHRGCLRGRSQRKQVFSADRMKYPMKRKHWEPGNPNGELRGKDEWERISWDEALDYVANETKRIMDTYGNKAIFADGVYSGCIDNLLNKLGGFVGMWGTHSFGSYAIPVLYNGFQHHGRMGGHDRLDILNAETLVLFGWNPAWSGCGTPSYYFRQLAEKSPKCFAIDPLYNETYSMLGAEWMPIYEGQDDAFILGVMHTLITEDDPKSNPLIDWDFLNRCTIGFDADHMPVGADPKNNFKDYVLGTYDGTPKTPEWASNLCGASAEQIRKLAYEIAPSKKVAIMTSWGPSRTLDTDHISQLFMTLGAMTGHMGKSGHMTSVYCDSATMDGGARLFTVGSDGNPSVKAPIDDCICSSELWKAIKTGEYTFNGRMMNYGFEKNKSKKAEKRTCDIHMIYSAGRSLLNSREDILSGVEVFRKMDFVVSHAWAPTAEAMYADIVLPITTPWERPGRIKADGIRDGIVLQRQVIEPLFEAKSDQDICRGLMKRFGIPETDLFCGSEMQQLFNQIAKTKVLDEDGKTQVTAFSITQADIDMLGVKGEPQQGKFDFSKIWEDGICVVARHEGDKYGYIAYKDFVEDPEGHPLKNSESGKFEIYCQKMADSINAMDYGTITPWPEYVAKHEGYESTFADFDKKIKGEYPYQAFSLRSLRTVLSCMENVPQLREAIKSPVFIAAADAEKEGISEGDAVRLISPYGSMIRSAQITQRIMPGVIAIPFVGWLEYDEGEKADRGGASNVLTGNIATGQGTSGDNTIIVKMEKYEEAVVPDCEKPQTIIFEEGK